MKEKEHIRELLEDVLPLVDFDSDFLFSELDSLGVTTILMVLSDAYGIRLEATDATPRNLKSLDSLEALVELSNQAVLRNSYIFQNNVASWVTYDTHLFLRSTQRYSRKMHVHNEHGDSPGSFCAQICLCEKDAPVCHRSP